MLIRHIVPSLEERHGGPSKSVRFLAAAQTALGSQVELLATQEPGETAPDTAGTPGLRLFPRETPLFLCRSTGLRDYSLGNRCDCVHSHALWLLTLRYAVQAARRHGAPLVISPRGMLSGWAYRHRRWRKMLAEILVHPGAFSAAAG